MAPGAAATDRAGEGRRSWAWVGALLAIGAVYFGLAVLARGYLFFGDVTTLDTPCQVLLRKSVRAGHLPLWNPYIFGGFPQFAEGQVAALYPLSLLAALLVPAHVAITWLVVVHRLLAGAFMFLLARAWGLPRSSAFIAGLVFMFSGFLFAHSMNWGLSASSAFVPLVFYFLEIGLQRRRAIYAVPAGATLALQFLLGYPPVAYLSLFAGAGYVLFRAAGLGMRRTWALACQLFFGALLLGAALAAVQLLPLFDLAGRSARTAHPLMDAWPGVTFGREGLVAYLAPQTHGNPALGNYRGSLEYPGYLGLLPLGLALLGAVGAFRRAWPFVVIGLAAMALATGAFVDPLTGLVRLATGTEMFRVPIRYLLVTTVCLSMLAGIGHAWLRRRTPLRGQSGGWLLACLALAAGWLALTFLVLPATARYSLNPLHGRLAPLSVGLLALSAAVVIAAAWRGGLSLPVFTGIGAALILLDLLPWAATQMPTVPGAYFTRPPAAARALQSDKGWYRIVTWRPVSAPYWSVQWPAREYARNVVEQMLPNIPESYGISSIEGYAGLFPLRQRDFISLMSWVVSKPGAPDTRVLDAAGVRYILSLGPLPGGGLKTVHRGPGPWIQRSPRALGPCWVVPRAVVLPDPNQVLRFMAGDDFSPTEAAVVECDVGLPGAQADAFHGGSRVVRLEATHMEFEAWASAPGLLVVNAAAYDPGWKARLDGRPAPVYPANRMFQAIALPAGRHRVILRYQPRPYLVGRQVSLAALVLIAVGLLWCGVRRCRPASRDPRT